MGDEPLHGAGRPQTPDICPPLPPCAAEGAPRAGRGPHSALLGVQPSRPFLSRLNVLLHWLVCLPRVRLTRPLALTWTGTWPRFSAGLSLSSPRGQGLGFFAFIGTPFSKLKAPAFSPCYMDPAVGGLVTNWHRHGLSSSGSEGDAVSEAFPRRLRRTLGRACSYGVSLLELRGTV